VAIVDGLNAAIADAMRQHDPIRLTALRMLKAALTNREVERGRALTTRITAGRCLARQAAQGFHSQFTSADVRISLTKKQRKSVSSKPICLPRRSSAVEQAVADAVRETGATSPKDMGKVMKAVMEKLAGQNVDGKTVNELVRRNLAGS
jgi:uncharacterized protein YqeY